MEGGKGWVGRCLVKSSMSWRSWHIRLSRSELEQNRDLTHHSSTLLSQEYPNRKNHAVSVRGLEEFTFSEAFGRAQLLFQADLDLVELCFDL